MKTFRKITWIGGWVILGIGFIVMAIMFFSPIGNWENYSNIVWIIMGIGAVLLVGGTLISLFTGNSSRVKNGKPALGTVTDTRQTGTYLNNQPQVEITFTYKDTEGKEYQGATTTFIAQTQLAAIQPGATLPIRYDEQNPSKVAIDGNMDRTTMQNLYDQEMIRKGVLTEETLDIAKNGQEAKGVIMTITPTGKFKEEATEMEVTVKVTKQDGNTYETTVLKYMLPTNISKFQPGTLVTVNYMPEDEKNIVISVKI